MPHKDLRRARSATNSIIPTKTGAASAVGKSNAKFKWKVRWYCITCACSLWFEITDFVCIVNKNKFRRSQ